MSGKLNCPLCGLERPVVESHILPEFLYDDVYSEGHSFRIYSTTPGSRPAKRLKGVYETLLCWECDNKLLGQLDDYASKIFKGGAPLEFHETGELVIVAGLDYQKFKLWQMSLLWRAGVSTRMEFRSTTLGPHSERIRHMLISGDPGEPHEYGCTVVLPASHGVAKQLMIPPEPVRLYGQKCYRATFGALWWIYVVSSHSADFERHDGFLTADGTWRIVKDWGHSTKFLVRRAADAGLFKPE